MSAALRVLLLAAPLAASTAAGGREGASSPRTHRVAIRDMRFEPEVVVVHPGDTVEWVNEDLVPHTVTARDRGFDSQTIATGGIWRWSAGTTGSAPYTCTFHPSMSGRLEITQSHAVRRRSRDRRSGNTPGGSQP